MEKSFLFNRVHLTGVGGISMSSIAKLLLLNGFEVSGSDIKRNEKIDELCDIGMRFFSGHSRNNVHDAELLIYNSAIKEDNEEIKQATEAGIPVFNRMEFLSLIADGFKTKVGIAGCHGKTTCTGMVATVLECAEKNFYAHIGGDVIPFGNCLYTGNEIFLSEICEYKRNADLFTADIAAVTNVGFDHPDCYKNKSEIAETYISFLKRAKTRIINSDDEILHSIPLKYVSFGLKNGDITAENIKETKEGVVFEIICDGKRYKTKLKVHGEYNVYNALCAFCICKTLKVNENTIIEGLEAFNGIKRRFEKTGTINGVPVICDYAHHPEEIKNCIRTAEGIYGKNIAVVFQPHTYSRTKALLNEFVNALNTCDTLCLYKTFPARETFDREGEAAVISDRIPQSYYSDTEEELKKYLRKATEKVKLVLVLGAGDIYDIIKKTAKAN